MSTRTELRSVEDLRVVALTCNNCGAGITTPDDVRFLTCSHCGARLQVERTNDAIFTTVLEKVAKVEREAATVASEIEIVKLERELEKIDARLTGLTDPGGYGVVWLSLGLALVGLSAAFSSDNERKAGGIVMVVICGLAALLIGAGLPSQIERYKIDKESLEKERTRCADRLRVARQRAVR